MLFWNCMFLIVAIMDRTCGDEFGKAKNFRAAGDVAFSVTQSSDLGPFEETTLFTFDGIEINDGDGFDIGSSVFTAPVAGLYSFTYSAKAIIGPELVNVDLYINGNIERVMNIDDGITNTLGMAVRLEAGQTAYVMIRGSLQTGTGRVECFAHQCVFDGYLVKADP